MNDLISVVIPAYNVATRIKTTLESVIAQDYPNIEIIVVNDSSTDNTEEIARDVLGKSERFFKLITNEHNIGVSVSRNIGINHAKGKYLSFIDADDLIKQNFLSSLYSEIVKDNCEIVYCGLIDRFTDGRPDYLKNHSDKLQVKPPVLGEDVILYNAMPSICCCLYDANFIRKYKLFFYEGCTAGEDVAFMMMSLCMAKKVTFIKQCLYIYLHYSGMGSIRDNNTLAKKILRYEHNTNAHINTAKYISRYADSERLKKFADNVLIPQSLIRQFTLYAMKNDKVRYNSLLRDESAISNLNKAITLYTFKADIEVFLKALIIKLLPGVYFVSRRRKYKA